MLGWYEKHIEAIRKQNLNQPQKAMDLIADSLALIDTGEWRQRLQCASANNPNEALKLLHQTESLYGEATHLLKGPYARFEKSDHEFRDRIERDPNPFPKVFLTAFIAPRTRAKEFRADTVFAMLQTAIECRLRGVGVLKAMPDPVSGHPFSLTTTATGFALKSEVKFEDQFVTLHFAGLVQPFKP